MNLDYCVRELASNSKTIETFVAGIDAAQMRWKPTENDWSMLEVVNHLWDEEREDFPARIRHLFSGSPDRFAPIRPAERVTERGYNGRDPGESLAGFLSEREKNLAWIRSLSRPDWEVKYAHEPLAGISAGDFLAAWTVHDLLHIRQLNELKYAFSARELEGRAIIYAGEW